MRMFNPPHPGEILKEDYVIPLKISITDMSKSLCISRKALSEIVNCKAGISPEMALKLGKAFNTTAEFWMNLQDQCDLSKAQLKVDLLAVEELYKAA